MTREYRRGLAELVERYVIDHPRATHQEIADAFDTSADYIRKTAARRKLKINTRTIYERGEGTKVRIVGDHRPIIIAMAKERGLSPDEIVNKIVHDVVFSV